ncbi:DNA repair protein crb2 [Ophiocordyceps camponoti-floridani]|uniref:DNA repair protein crb2 n=1 Tax=Ophiocordyceps camponoti-floridani TaxID=2030778 RepID=A0A8H4Q5K6_9HYPO|nr:DNA repair protein crb2 [Ophiocordyceps camponoti-floridani]
MAPHSVSESQDTQAILDAHRPLFGARSPRGENEAASGPLQMATAEAMPMPEEKQAHGYTTRKTSPVLKRGANMGTRMDVSQHTPTQANADRDYSAFCEGADEPRTLVEGDTGAVLLGQLRTSSQVSEDGGLDTTRSGWRGCRRLALRLRLKGGIRLGVVGEGASPTSSRPSPRGVTTPGDILERGGTTSSLRMSGSSPVVTGRKTGCEDLIPESPTTMTTTTMMMTTTTARPGLSRGPSAHYEPMKKSQERKTIVESRREMSPESDYDDALKRADRRRRAERKRAQAAEEMEKVRFARAARGEQPRKRRRVKDSAARQVKGNERLEEERIPATSPADGPSRDVMVSGRSSSLTSPTASVATTASRGRRRSPALMAPRRSLRASCSSARKTSEVSWLVTSCRRLTDETCAFRNMVFALSLRSEGQRRKLERLIEGAGGTILADDFQGLFAPFDVDGLDDDDGGELELAPGHDECVGFVALIADGHSRKTKFIQALALGIPCLAQQWVSACLSRGEAVDWEPYLLCAGSSAVLGNAIRSRTLTAYPASWAKLVDVVSRRRRLLEGKSVVALIRSRGARGGASDRERLFLFLVRAMAPERLLVVRSGRERVGLSKCFDWVYGEEGEKSEGVYGRRVLTDEIVIQSLILGRMVEEGEM